MSEKIKPSAEQIREFVIAGHGNLDRVKEMLAENPAFLNVMYEWGPNDTETAIQGAAHVGNAPIINYLLQQGAPLELCTAATLGRRAEVETMLAENPENVRIKGAHGIPLLTHAALSGDVDLVAMLFAKGATDGVSPALGNAVNKGHVALVHWLLENTEPDLGWQNFQGKTPVELATEQGHEEIVLILQQHQGS